MYLCSLEGIQQKSQSNPPDKVRVSHATFCGKHSAPQMDPEWIDTYGFHSKDGSFGLTMDTPAHSIPVEYLFLAEWDLNS